MEIKMEEQLESGRVPVLLGDCNDRLNETLRANLQQLNLRRT